MTSLDEFCKDPRMTVIEGHEYTRNGKIFIARNGDRCTHPCQHCSGYMDKTIGCARNQHGLIGFSHLSSCRMCVPTEERE